MNESLIDPTKTNWLKVLPCDALFFGDGSPFNRGEDHGESGAVFPPFPSTMSGAMRFALALANAASWDGKSSWQGHTCTNGSPLEAVVGNGANDLGKLSFSGPLIANQNELLFPVPRHILGFQKLSLDGSLQFSPQDWLVPGVELTCDVGKMKLPKPKGISKVCVDEKHPEPSDGMLLNSIGMKNVLEGRLPEKEHFLDIRSLVHFEQRVGIARNPRTGRVDDRMLYNPKFIRLAKDCGLVYGVRGKPESWNWPQHFTLGGESRMATLEPSFSSCFLTDLSKLKSGSCVLVLLTPAIFSNSNKWWGASPGDNAKELNPVLSGKIATTIVDRPVRIGGWDSVSKKPQSTQPCARAGTCWYIDDWNEPANRLCFVGSGTNHGYGLALACNVPADN